jgi:ssDNA-binding Zn-finger/Zn-ribbon topoisomerase 1
VLRTARRGRNAGSDFLGCSTYPKCQAMLPVEA